MNSPADDVRAMLDMVSSLGLTFESDLFVSDMPDSPDSCVCVYDTGGFAPQPNFVYEFPTVQVRVRGVAGEYLSAYNVAYDIMFALNGDYGIDVGDAHYVGIWAMQSPMFVGRDDKNRPIFTINFRLHRGDDA